MPRLSRPASRLGCLQNIEEKEVQENELLFLSSWISPSIFHSIIGELLRTRMYSLKST